MIYYRRNFVSGAGYFFTVNLADRKSCLLIDHIDELRAAFRYVRQRHPFALDAIVVLPDHLHAIWTLPEGDADFSVRWRLIKSAISRALSAGEKVSRSRAAKGERSIWQRRYWEHTLRNDRISNDTSITSISTPVKHGLVQRVRDWPHSSFARMVRNGAYPEDWAGDNCNDTRSFGER